LVDDHDGRVAEFRKLTAAAKKHGSLIVCQLSHPGRQGSAGLNPNPVGEIPIGVWSLSQGLGGFCDMV
jgi:2,4-dienoyl-CoA reductase-like NADH-dependent reductase (Old Yellow Enzyme family)